MKPFLTLLLFLSLITHSVLASGVVITSIPDTENPLAPLTSLAGVPLAAGVQVRIGAFPGMSDEQILNAAASGGLAQILSSFVPFGAASSIGIGVNAVGDGFEMAARENPGAPLAPWVGQIVSLLIQQPSGSEFLVARFSGKIFEAGTLTGLEPLLSLHLAEAEIIVGNRYRTSHFATSPAPSRGAFAPWIGSFISITDPNLRLPEADADADGRSNFLEYATGGNPSRSNDSAPCHLVSGGDGAFWVRFSRATGLGAFTPAIEESSNLLSPWTSLTGAIETDPNPPTVTAGVHWMRIRVPQPLAPSGFFRLNPSSKAR